MADANENFQGVLLYFSVNGWVLAQDNTKASVILESIIKQNVEKR